MKINLTIDGKSYVGTQGQTVLEVCKENKIFVPTFCHDQRLKPYTSCFICIVEVKGGRGKFSPSCSTEIQEGMEVVTDSKDIRQTRKMNLELLLSNHLGDCYAPCTMECPSTVDIPGYISMISRGMYKEAVRLIREENPLPLVCGRVCARPCEDVCRRHNIDSEVAIDWLKRFATDYERNNGGPLRINKENATGKKVAVIGAGPGGLACAYYLSLQGHAPVIFERLPEPGGMLRYGIPAYRMPRDLLREEIDYLLSYGSELRCNQSLGKDFTMENLQKDYDAIFLATGAQKGSSARAGNENLALQGVDFLREVNLGEEFDFSGKTVVVLGGGNTAIDCARSSVRLGAAKVIIAYRRTEKEMPAADNEIVDAKEEGVEIKELCAPQKFNGDADKLQSITLDMMKLGEPDDSGRRRPIKNGEQEELVCDIAIAAIGQKVDATGLTGVDLEDWGTIKYQPSFATNVEGVFTGGDAARGPGIAIQAIADGKLAARSIDQYLKGEEVTAKGAYDDFGFYIKRTDLLSKKELKDYLSDRESLPKCEMPMISPKERVKSWDEVEKGLDLETALKEAERCLECGCQDVNECKLKKYAEIYSADCTRFKGKVDVFPTDQSHPYLAHDPSKCILCGSCVRICQDLEGVSALGYTHRGFASIVQTDFNDGFKLSRCIGCGACIEACPVGALTEKITSGHQGPLQGEKLKAICLACADGCEIEVEKIDDTIIRVTADKDKGLGLVCKKGKFAFCEQPQEKVVLNGKVAQPEDAARWLKEKLIENDSLAIAVGNSIDTKSLNAAKSIAKKHKLPIFNSYTVANKEKMEICKDLELVDATNFVTNTVFYLGSTSEDCNSVSQRKLFQNRYYLYSKADSFLQKNALGTFNDVQKILNKLKEVKDALVIINPEVLTKKELQLICESCPKESIRLQLPWANMQKMTSWNLDKEIKNYKNIINIGDDEKRLKSVCSGAKIVANFTLKSEQKNALLCIGMHPYGYRNGCSLGLSVLEKLCI